MDEKTQAKESFSLLSFVEKAIIIESILKKHNSPLKKVYEKTMHGNTTDANLYKASMLADAIFNIYVDEANLEK